ncbi:DUF3570 domain-containing protein [Flavisolibacter tropicus]|uniref:DUF3570 domain-containing protein n=1 Tax=Flavisolibacter tropicus TaxID=1492898 RepID=A0A172TUW6_9BACT|nr:DUF3570 domain-containing protein [Flavisolibacter tropicus]ANE50792.1 hypothetical protein SY85_10045 [Flavisolibacter tropicus]
MRKLSLAVIGMYISVLSAYSQSTSAGDSSHYKSKKLNLDEVNLVTGYYQQTGDHSAVTGGVGTEALNDIATTIELRLYKYDRKQRRHNFNLELGVDHYTSASSDKIDPYTISSPSHSDTRVYPSIGWTVQNEEKKTTFGLTGSLSNEFDYQSYGLGASFTKASKDNNREFSARAQAYFDTWKVIYPIELRGGAEHNEESSPRNSFSASLSLAQVVNTNLQLLLVTEPTYQNGLLATKYQRVYFTNSDVKAETLPNSRVKIPLGVRANYFLGDRFIVRSFYRYYQDDWGVKAHTLDLETPIKLTPFASLTPFYRYYTQAAADYFAPYAQHTPAEAFYTSDYDLSKFHSQFFGAGIRLVPLKGVLGIAKWNSVELKYGHYIRSNNLQSNQLSLHIKVK